MYHDNRDTTPNNKQIPKQLQQKNQLKVSKPINNNNFIQSQIFGSNEPLKTSQFVQNEPSMDPLKSSQIINKAQSPFYVKNVQVVVKGPEMTKEIERTVWVENSDKIDMLQRENGRLKKMIGDKDFLIEKLQKNKLQLESNLNMLKDFRDKHQSLDVRVSQLVAEKEKLQELIQFKDKSINALHEDQKQKIAQIQQIQAKLDDHDKNTQQYELAIAHLKQQVAGLEIYQTKMEENELKVQAQLDEIAQLRHDLLQTDRLNNELQSQLADQNRLIDNNVRLEEQVKKLNNEIDNLKNKYGNLLDSDAKLNDYVLTIQNLKNQNDAFCKEIGELQEQLEKAKQKLAARSDYDNIKQNLEYMKQKNDEQLAIIDGLQDQIRQLEQQLDLQQQDMQEKEEKFKRSQKDRGNRDQQDKLKQDYKKLINQVDQLQNELNREQEKYAQLQQQLKHYTDIEKQKQAVEDQLADMLGDILGGNGERNKLSKRVKDLEDQIAQYKDFDAFILKNEQLKADVQRLYNLISQKDDKISQLEKQLQLSDTEAQEQLRQQIYKEQERFNKLSEQYTHLLNIENQKKETEDQLAEMLGQIMSGKGERQTLSKKNKELQEQLDQFKDYEMLILKFSQQQQALQRLQQQLKDKNIQIQLLEDKLKQSEEENAAKLRAELEKEKNKLHQLEEKFGYLLKIEGEKKQQEDVLAESLGKILSGDGERTKLVQRNKELLGELEKYKDFEIMILKVASLQGNLDKFKNSNNQKDKIIKELNDKIIALQNQSQDKLQAELAKQNKKYDDLYVEYQRLLELELQQKKMEDKVEDVLSQVLTKNVKHKSYKQKCKELQDELNKYKDYEILILKFGQQQKAIEKLKQTIQEKDQKINELTGDLHQLKVDLEKLNQAKLDLEQNLNKYRVLLQQKEEQYNILNENNNKLSDELQKYRLEVTKHQQYQDDLQAELKKYNDYQILVLKLSQLQQHIKRLEKSGENKDELNKNLQDKITKLEQEVHILEQGTKTRDNEIDRLNQLQKHDHEENLQIFKQFQNATSELEKAREQVIKLEGQTRDLLMELSKYHDYEIILQKLSQTQQNYLHIKNEFDEKLDLIKRLEDEINLLKAKVDVLERSKQQQASSIQQIQALVQEKDLHILNLEAQYKQLQEELDQLKRNQLKQQNYIQELQDELARYADYQQLLFKYQQAQEYINKYKDTIAQLEREIQRYKDTLLQLEDALQLQEKEKKQLHNDYTNLKAQYEVLLHENTTLKDEIIRQKSEIENLRLKIQSKDVQINDLNEELAKYADYHQLVIQFKQAEDLIQKLKNTIKEKDLQISSLQQQLADLQYNQQQIISKFEKKVDDLLFEIQKLQAENKTLRDTLEQIKEAYEALQNDLADSKNAFGQQYNEWQLKFKQLEEQLKGDFEFKQNQYLNEIDNLKRLIAELQETIELLNSEISEYKIKLISFSQNDTMIQELQDQLKRLEMQVNFKDQEIGNLRQQLSFSTDYEKKIRVLTDEINKETQKSFELEKKLATSNLSNGDLLKFQTKWQDQMGLTVLLFGEIENLRAKLQEKN